MTKNTKKLTANEETRKVKRWLREIKTVQESKTQKAFERNGEKIVKDYRNAQSIELYETRKVLSSRVMFNVLWANTQVLKSALYSGLPDVVVERTFKDIDPVARVAGLICERSLHFMIESQEDRVDFAFANAVEDRLLPGRGQVWLRYDAEFETLLDDQGNPVVDEETGEEIKTPKANSEKVCIDYVHWCDYFEAPARNVYEVKWKARKAYMTRAELIAKFGDLGKAVELQADNKRKRDEEDVEFTGQAEVYEIWDYDSKKVYWVSEGYIEAPLKEISDPLRLKDFFPCPIPLLATTSSDSTYPTPDYKIYEKLADEYDFLCKREAELFECIRFVGATAAQFNKDIKNILSLKDGSLWPVENWAAFAEKNGFDGIIDWIPFENVVNALPSFATHKQNILQQIYEITGIPDIARGLTDPRETLGAQQRKLRALGTKTEEKARDVQRFIKDVYNKCAEIIFEPGLFSDETIGLICGFAQLSPEDQAIYPQALELLRNDRLRTFRIDIETTSTTDEELEREGRMQFLSTVGQIASNIEQINQYRPELLHPLIESARFTLATFRNGRTVLGAFEAAWSKIEQNQKRLEQNPLVGAPDYQGQALQIEAQKVQLEGQIENNKLALENQRLILENQKAQADFELETKKLDIEAQKVLSRAQIEQMDQELKTFKEQYAQFVQNKTLELQEYKVVLDEKEKFLEEARLNYVKDLEVQKAATLQTLSKRPKKKIARTKRLPDGSLIGESYEVDDDGGLSETNHFIKTPDGKIIATN